MSGISGGFGVGGGISGPGLGGVGGGREQRRGLGIDGVPPRGPGRLKPERPRVFGVGLSKTGTTSVAEALRVLGYSVIHYPRPEFTMTGRFGVLHDYDAAFDTSVSVVFQHLDRVYPGSKFVLTVREPEGWIKSLERHLALRGPRSESGFEGALRRMIFGVTGFDRERLLAAQAAWDEQVRAYFRGREGDLLVLNLSDGDGWAPLCAFLGEPEPGVAFPHKNKLGASARGREV